MISREEYEGVIDSFLMELQGFFGALSEAELERLFASSEELREAVLVLRDGTGTDDELLGAAYGSVDEFIHAVWHQLIAESYALYVDLSGGKSHRHPGGE